MFQNFPYTDMHQLNLDWIIKIAKDFLDQYTHLQQLIADGEASLTEKTEAGLTALQEKADTLTDLLDAWYQEHSADIANQLADALNDLNQWYTTHQNYLDNTLAANIAAFNSAAETKAAETILTIPDDYTYLSNQVQNILKEINFNAANLIPFGKTVTYAYSNMPIFADHKYIDQTGTLYDETSGITSAVLYLPSKGIKKLSITATATQSQYAGAYIVVVDYKGTVKTYLFSGASLTVQGNTYYIEFDRNGFNYESVMLINWIGRTGETVESNSSITVEYYTKNEWTMLPEIESVANKTYDIYTPALPMYETGKYMDFRGDLHSLATANVRIFDPELIDSVSITYEAGHAAYPTIETPFAILKDSSGTLIDVLNPTTAGTYTLNIDHEKSYKGTLYINEFDTNAREHSWRTSGGLDVYATYHMTVKRRVNNIEFIYKDNIRKPFNFNNKTIVFIGDSITAGVIDTDPDIEYTTETWVKHFCDRVNANATNIAVAGSCYYKNSNVSATSILEQLQSVQETPDYFFIAGGTNDWLFGTSDANMRSSVQAVISYLHTNYPNTPVIFITPINCYDWKGYPQTLKIDTLQHYRNIISEEVLANDWSQFSLIQGNTFDFPEKPALAAFANAVFGDGLHPSVIGYRTIYAPKVMEALL